MNILLIAPHPFFKERGTPIAVKLLLETLSESGHSIDLLTYHEGSDVSIPRVRTFRIFKPPFVKNIPIAFSWKKVVSDFFLSGYLVYLALKYRYDVIHAVEESIFPAAVVNLFSSKKLVYDMDSSLADQMIEKWAWLKHFQRILYSFENWAFERSDVVVPVCRQLADKVKNHNPDKKVYVLEDIAFETNGTEAEAENLRGLIDAGELLCLYVGNLEFYQGIDLLLDSISNLKGTVPFRVVIIGGIESDINKYQEKSRTLGINKRVLFVGPRPLKLLPYYLQQADLLISPRIKGQNTPMKIYSYLASGKPIVATDIGSHTQVLDNSCALLVKPETQEFMAGLKRLIDEEKLREELGTAGQRLAKQNYSLSSYKRKLNDIYDALEAV
jgi:glycosyltransferase involved in cell wall biosynthesis